MRLSTRGKAAAFFATLFTLSAWFRTREYKSGTGWCFWRWTDTDSAYILRLHVLKTPWFAVCLHWIRKPDAEPWLHDHPVNFLSIILRGSYAEKRQRVTELAPRHRVHRWFNFIRASDFDRHTIIFARKNTLTLCLMGPKTREWGFHTPTGWVMWKDYYALHRAGEPVRTEAFWLDRIQTVESLTAMMKAKIGRGPTALEMLEASIGPAIDRMTKMVGYTMPHTIVDEVTRPIDILRADDFIAEEPTPPREWTISRKDFYKKARP